MLVAYISWLLKMDPIYEVLAERLDKEIFYYNKGERTTLKFQLWWIAAGWEVVHLWSRVAKEIIIVNHKTWQKKWW